MPGCVPESPNVHICPCIAQVECVEVPWGCGADEAKLEQILKADTDKKVKAVAVVHNETTTGVTSDIKQVREVRNEPWRSACWVSRGLLPRRSHHISLPAGLAGMGAWQARVVGGMSG